MSSAKVLQDVLQEGRSLHPKEIDLSLKRMNRLLCQLGNPQKKMGRVIHVAGTNGKGSTIAFLEVLLKSLNKKVHKYISPHLIHFSERICLADDPRSTDQQKKGNSHSNEKATQPSFFQQKDQLLANTLDKILKINDHQPLTEFELITATAFYLFSHHQTDYTLIEVGLGGRLDATNVIENPKATVITSIGFDHMEFLGKTIKEIAFEKAGIIKPQIPIFVPSTLADEALTVIEKKALSCEAPFILVNDDTVNDDKLQDIGLKGAHQKQNAALALAVVRYLEPNHPIDITCLKKTHWPGRLQTIPVPVRLGDDKTSGRSIPLLLDGAHNTQGILALKAFIQSEFKEKVIFFLHIKKRKNALEMMNLILEIAKKIYISDFPKDGGESFSATDIQTLCPNHQHLIHPLESMGTLKTILSTQQGPFVATGSLFWVGHLLKEFEI